MSQTDNTGSGTGAGAGAATGAAIGTVIPGVGSAIGAAIGAIIGLIPSLGFRTATTHLDRPGAVTLTEKLFTPVWQAIQQNLTSSQVQQLSLDLQNSVANFMANTDWWTVGNDVAGRATLIRDIINEKANPGSGAFYRLGIWIWMNSPKDNPKEALTRINDALSATLYPELNALGATALANSIQAGIAQQQAGADTTQQKQTTTDTNFLDKLFGKKDTTTGGPGFTTNQASIGMIAVYVVLGMILIGILFATGRKVITAGA